MGTAPADEALPYPGDLPATVTALADGIRTGSAQLAAFADGIDAARGSLQAAWSGDDAAAADQEVGTLVTVCLALITRADAALAAVNSHQNDLTTIRQQVDVLRMQWAEASEALDSALFTQLLTPTPIPATTPAEAAAPAGAGADEPVYIGGWEIVSAAESARRQQVQIDSYRQQLTDLQAQWQVLVTSQEESAAACRSALDAATHGHAGLQDGGLWAMVGAGGLIFDDRERAEQVVAVSGNGGSGSAIPDAKWNLLSDAERGFYRGLAQAEYSLPLVLGGTGAIPSLWGRLPPMAQQSLIYDKPDEIGSTNGLPVVARDQANRITLPDALATTRAELDKLVADGPAPVFPGNDSSTYMQLQVNQDAWQHGVDTATAKIAALTDIQSTLTTDHQPPTYLMDLDATGRGLAVIASGNPDTSAVVATYVPGTGSELGNVGGDVRRSEDMVEAALTAGASSAAAITWVGYHSPPTIPEAAKEGYADASVGSLDSFIDGVRASHQAGEPFRSVVLSHSYGTLLVAHAASGENSLNADALVLVASPGTDVDSAQDLHLDGIPATAMRDHVFATASAVDPVADTPGFIFSGDPTHADFGATVFPTEAHEDPDWYYNVADHSAYWAKNSVSLRNIGIVIAGGTPEVPQ